MASEIFLAPPGTLSHLANRFFNSEQFRFNIGHQDKSCINIDLLNTPMFSNFITSLTKESATNAPVPESVIERETVEPVDFITLVFMCMIQMYYLNRKSLDDLIASEPSDQTLADLVENSLPERAMNSKVLSAMLSRAFFLTKPEPIPFATILVATNTRIYQMLCTHCASSISQEDQQPSTSTRDVLGATFPEKNHYMINGRCYLALDLFTLLNDCLSKMVAVITSQFNLSGGEYL